MKKETEYRLRKRIKELEARIDKVEDIATLYRSMFLKIVSDASEISDGTGLSKSYILKKTIDVSMRIF